MKTTNERLKLTNEQLKNLCHTVGEQIVASGAPPFMLIIVQEYDEGYEKFCLTSNVPESKHCEFMREAHASMHDSPAIELDHWRAGVKH